MLTLISGLAAGAAHVVSGPDHLAALAPIAADAPKRAASLGFRWGLGHGVGVVALGLLGIVARGWINVDVFSAWAEASVGFILVGLGLWAFRRASRMVVHTHPHAHGEAESNAGEHEQPHHHYHVHDHEQEHDSSTAHNAHSHAAFFVGMLHGAAGAGHLFGVLPSLALPQTQALLYLGSYFIAAVLAMTAFGGTFGWLSRFGGVRSLRAVMYGSAIAAVVVGIVWIGQSWPSA